MKRIYSTLLIVLGLLVGASFAFGQVKKTPSFSDIQDNGKDVKIYSYGQDVHVKSDVSGIIVVCNLKGAVVAQASISGSETIITVDGSESIYIVSVIKGSKLLKTEKVIIK
jgi:hypothetical protein